MNNSTLRGWMCEQLFGIVTGAVYAFVNSVLLSFFIAISLHYHAFYTHFRAIINEWNEQQGKEMTEISTTRKKLHILAKAVEYHVLAKE